MAPKNLAYVFTIHPSVYPIKYVPVCLCVYIKFILKMTLSC